MTHWIRHTVPLSLFALALTAHGQFYKLHGASISVGATGQFSTELTSNNTGATTFLVPLGGSGGTTYPETALNRQQFTTDSTGFVTSLEFHPVAFAGVELNYGFTHYSERYTFNYTGVGPQQAASVPTDMHETTAAYQFHPHHIPFQPFVNIGGGAVDFSPQNASNQWRGAGLLEGGFDLPTRNKHIAFRVEGRSLYYRSPNFYQPVISTKSWRVTEEPSFSSVYRF